MQIPFSPPDITNLEIDEVVKTLQSGWITTGPRTKEFEKNIANYCNVQKAVCLNSATACLESILRILDIGAGDEVITTAYTYTATASPVCHIGAKLILVDTMPGSYEMDYSSLERAITNRTKAVIPVDIGGVLCDYDRILKILEEKRKLFVPKNKLQEAIGRVILIEDAAHAFGARMKDEVCGNIADFTSFSFHAVKNLTTAEGGALTWKEIPGVDNDRLYNEFMLFSLHGQSKDALAKTQLGAWEYDVISPAYKCNMTDIMAAVGLKQLERYPELLKRRREIINKYDKVFLEYNLLPLKHTVLNKLSSGHLYMLRIPGICLQDRNEIIINMAKKGITTNVHYKPLPMMTAYKKLGFEIKDYPNAYRQFENEITLPLHTCLTDEMVEYVIENFLDIIEKRGILNAAIRLG